MKTTIEMHHTEKIEYTATITCERISNGHAPEYHEAYKSIDFGEGLDPVIIHVRSDKAEPVHEQVYSWIGQMHFQGWEILQKRVDD